MKDYPHLMLFHRPPFCTILPSWYLNQVFSKAQSRSSTLRAKGDPLLAASRRNIFFSSTQPVVRIQNYTASWQWQSTRQAKPYLDCAQLLLFIILTEVVPTSRTGALLMLDSVKTQPKMHLLSFDFILSIPQCSHRGSKLFETRDVIFEAMKRPTRSWKYFLNTSSTSETKQVERALRLQKQTCPN